MNHNLVVLNLIQHLLSFLLVYADCIHSQVYYYITPSESTNIHCPQYPCLTLAQFDANSSDYFNNGTNISLSYLPGKHILDRVLSLSQIHTFSMIENSEATFVECDSQSGRFNISEMTLAIIKGLHFIGCGGNSVSQVEQFIVEDTINFSSMQKAED